MANGLRRPIAKTSSSVPSGRTRRMPPPRCDRVVPSFPFALWKPVVADGDVDPAVEPHADAVGRVVAAAFVDLAGRQARDEHVLAVGGAVAVLVDEHAQERRMQTQTLPSWAITPRGCSIFANTFTRSALPSPSSSMQRTTRPPPGRAAERPLLVHGHVDRAVRGHRQGHRVADPRRGREQADLEARRGLDDLADRLVVDRLERCCSRPAARS